MLGGTKQVLKNYAFFTKKEDNDSCGILKKAQNDSH
jgi:hypothetical protein